jgi:[ribosomal protein S5]-alanine N-acetyltransferase
VLLKQDLAFIGWCGLKYRAELREIDLGYRFIKKYWGKGYATEAAFACMRYGFEKLGLQRIVGRALPPNATSVKGLEKCGMIFIGEEMEDGHMAKTYELVNPFIH